MRTLSLMICLLALAGCTRKHVGNFNYYSRNTGDKSTYVILNDGKKIRGTRINTSDNLNYNTVVEIDGRSYKSSEVYAFQMGGMYFLRNGSVFLKRIIEGPKLNVYSTMHRTSIREGSYESPGHTYIITWLQRGASGKPFRFSHAVLAAEVKDCPMAYELANKPSSQLRKLTRSNIEYFNEIVAIYNNNCQKPEL